MHISLLTVNSERKESPCTHLTVLHATQRARSISFSPSELHRGHGQLYVCGQHPVGYDCVDNIQSAMIVLDNIQSAMIVLDNIQSAMIVWTQIPELLEPMDMWQLKFFLTNQT